ncbi:MAG: protein kinase [Candidatus Zixiibacteriota bacterium]|nr:MAG: protein kinase [candidate division Zixibacteria bacterium]
MELDDDKTRTHITLTKDTMVGHYRIVEKIGSGGMGEVYLAQDTELDRKVALKFLPPHLCQDEDCRKRFKREAQAAAKLDHPNIISVFEVSEYHGRPYFAMAHVEGRSLKEFSAGKELTIEQILELAVQICQGLQAAHDSGIIHRDIKPSNVLIDSHGRARIVDFGLATVKDASRLTKTGSTMGTAGYMSPEQVRGQEVDQRADLFSLGVVLYEMITGRQPFHDEHEAAIQYNILNEQPEPLARFKTGLPEGLQAIIDKALDKDVKTRYQHADGLCSDLVRIKRSLESAQISVAGISAKKKSPVLWWMIAALVVIVGVVLFITKPWESDTMSDQPETIMLAVLPFENLGNPEDEYFADGMTDEIISRLAALHGLGVISRTSSMQYKKTTKNLRQIGEELGVDVILEGTIRWDKSGDSSLVRINPQLIRVDDDVHLWADRYDATIDDIFALQTKIAMEVVEKLDVTLLASERQALVEPPTANMEAYDYYLRGIDYLYMPPSEEENLTNAIAMLSRAIELEPEFISAHVWLSFAHGQMYLFRHDRSEERLALAKRCIDQLLKIAPTNVEAHVAFGFYYYQCLRDFDRALEEFTFVCDNLPGDAAAYMGVGVIKRVQGDWNASAQNWRKAVELDPLSARVCFECGYTLYCLRRYAEAERLFDRAIRLSPDWHTLYYEKVWLHLLWTGDLDAARGVLEEALRNGHTWSGQAVAEIVLAVLGRDYELATARLVESAVIMKDFIELGNDSGAYYNFAGDMYRYMGLTSMMEANYDSARLIFEQLVQSEPDNPNYHAELGHALAGLGRVDDAIRESERAVEIVPISKDAMRGLDYLENLAEVYTRVGEYDLAIDQLDILLSIPSWVSVPYLKIYPEYDPLRDHLRFKALLEKYEKIHGT